MDKQSLNQLVGHRLKELQEDHLRMSGVDFAKALVIDESSLSKLKKGRLGITPLALFNLSENHSVNISWLITGLGVWKNIPDKFNSERSDLLDQEKYEELLINQKAAIQYLREIQVFLQKAFDAKTGISAIAEVMDLIEKGKKAGKGKRSNSG